MYKRTIVNTYSCCCSSPSNTTIKTRTLFYTHMETVEYQGGFVWAGIPSTWPPLTITDYVVAYAKARCEKEKPFEERFFPSRALPFPNLFEPL